MVGVCPPKDMMEFSGEAQKMEEKPRKNSNFLGWIVFRVYLQASTTWKFQRVSIAIFEHFRL
jgi:hypothetical protein